MRLSMETLVSLGPPAVRASVSIFVMLPVEPFAVEDGEVSLVATAPWSSTTSLGCCGPLVQAARGRRRAAARKIREDEVNMGIKLARRVRSCVLRQNG
jgi:hypothetical protein